jgi:hypothetical protein
MTDQIKTVPTTVQAIMRHPHFARGLAEVRAGLRFDPDIEDGSWAYERGRLFGMIAPLSMQLFEGRKLNQKAIALYRAARQRRLVI